MAAIRERCAELGLPLIEGSVRRQQGVRELIHSLYQCIERQRTAERAEISADAEAGSLVSLDSASALNPVDFVENSWNEAKALDDERVSPLVDLSDDLTPDEPLIEGAAEETDAEDAQLAREIEREERARERQRESRPRRTTVITEPLDTDAVAARLAATPQADVSKELEKMLRDMIGEDAVGKKLDITFHPGGDAAPIRTVTDGDKAKAEDEETMTQEQLLQQQLEAMQPKVAVYDSSNVATFLKRKRPKKGGILPSSLSKKRAEKQSSEDGDA